MERDQQSKAIYERGTRDTPFYVDEINSLTAQRDELLAALRALLYQFDDPGWAGGARAALDNARLVIAEAGAR